MHALAPYGGSDQVQLAYDAAGLATDRPARVIRVDRISCVVATPDGDRIATATDLPAVGDWVTLDGDADRPTIAAVVPRRSTLTRHDADRERVQVIAANVDLVLICAPGDRPSASRVERECVLAWESGATPVVILTKADAVPEGYVEELQERIQGVEVVTTAVVEQRGVAEVAALLAPNRTAVMLGPSGAGKSTLANALLGEEHFATGEVREDDRRGRHTTSSRALVVIPSGGVLIDTPGIRTLGLGDVDEGLDATFTDIVELVAACKFSDCSHSREPGCAVRAAVAAGELDSARLANFLRLEAEVTATPRG
ncbi:MAG: ribosome small subunit-dependent GTPase A, partial [Acidimicrobiia bacterium]|nr:ribosome small subunit-dependent GTPase A [Acidimicrobiia bacterium]